MWSTAVCATANSVDQWTSPGNPHVSQFSKWLKEIPADATALEAARMALARRLEVVLHYLPLAAMHAEADPEHVHKVRTSARRATAALRIFKELIPSKRYAKVTEAVKGLRRAAGEARDLDVFLQRLEKAEDGGADWLVEKLRVRRLQAQKPIVKAYEDLNRGAKLAKQRDKLLAALRPGDRASAGYLRDWAPEQLRQASRRFFAGEPADFSDYDALHEFRIKGKRVRYGIELFAAVLPDAARQEAYPAIENLQDRLGAVNDHRAAANQLAAWRDHISSDATNVEARGWLDAHIDEERRATEEKREVFAGWWTEERRLRLRDLTEAN